MSDLTMAGADEPRMTETGEPVVRDFEQLREHGLLALINATVFHPRGYGLTFNYSTENGERTLVGWSIQGDASEPWAFAHWGEQFRKASAFLSGVHGLVEAAGWGPRAEPVAGTGETLYRKCKRCSGTGQKAQYVGASLDDPFSHCGTCHGKRFVPVAPPEPLSAEEIATMAMQMIGRVLMADEFVVETIRLLPARFAVPVEGA